MKEEKSMLKMTTFETKSIEEIAFLRYKGFRLVGPPFGEGRYKWARFEDSFDLRSAVQSFYNGSTEKRLFDELRNAKQYLMD